jgi:hypothetical protein
MQVLRLELELELMSLRHLPVICSSKEDNVSDIGVVYFFSIKECEASTVLDQLERS